MSGGPDRASRAERERALLAQMAATIFAGYCANPSISAVDPHWRKRAEQDATDILVEIDQPGFLDRVHAMKAVRR